MFIYFWERERDRVRAGEGQREGEAQSPKRAPGPSCQHRARCGARIHEPREHDLTQSWTLNWLSHPGTPTYLFFNVCLFLRERERQSVSRGGAERGRHRIGSRLQAPSFQYRARRGARTHKPRDHDLSRSRTLRRLSRPGAPKRILFKYLFKGRLGGVVG